MSKPFKKSVMVDAMEYDRLRQRQVREYQPELSKLAQLQEQMAAILGNRRLSDHQKIVMLADPRAQFDKLRAELGVLSGAVRESNGSAAAIPSDDSAPAAPKEPEAEEDPMPKTIPALDWEDLNIPNTAARKARRLLNKISESPGVIRANEEGELVVNGDPVPRSNFVKLVRSLFASRKPNAANMVGLNELFAGLRQLQVTPAAFSSSAMRALYNPEQVVTRDREPGIYAGGEVQQTGKGGIFSKTHSSKPKIKYPKLEHVPLLSDNSLQDEQDYEDLYVNPAFEHHKDKKKKKQEQKGRGASAHPPGARPNILYVY